MEKFSDYFDTNKSEDNKEDDYMFLSPSESTSQIDSIIPVLKMLALHASYTDNAGRESEALNHPPGGTMTSGASQADSRSVLLSAERIGEKSESCISSSGLECAVDDDASREHASPDTENYEDLLATVRSELLHERQEESIDFIAKYFNDALDRAYSLVLKGFNIIKSLIAEESPTKINTYLENTSSVIQSLTKYIKDTSELVEMQSELFDAFTKQGIFLLRDVFEHCKNSEITYGEKICTVEGNLKELFRSCAELHQVYRDVLLNAIVFDDLDDRSRYQSFVNVMSGITVISDIVIDLDVKTLAENWKTFVAMCEKYVDTRASQVVQSQCIQSLQSTIMRTVKSCIEDNLEQKALIRSLKVANFLLKISIKLCQLFKHYNPEDYIPLLIFIKSNAESYLRSTDTPDELVELIRSHVTVAAEPLLSELLDCELFAEEVLGNVGDLQTDFCPIERGVLGYGLLLASVMSAVLQRDDPAIRDMWLSGNPERNIICCALQFMSQPKCHIWLMYGLKLEICVKKGEQPKCCGLYEHLLTVAAALSATVNPQQYAAIERSMLATLLQGDEWASLYAADLWVILARYGSAELCVQQITDLTDIYSRLREKEGRSISLQSLHLRSTLQRLFTTLSYEDRLRVYEKANETSRQDIFVKYLPELEAKKISERIFRKLEVELRKLLSRNVYKKCDFYYLIESIRSAAQCVPSPECVPLEAIVECWQKCYIQKRMTALLDAEETAVQQRCWFTDLVLALCELTSSLCAYGVIGNKHLIQILDVLESIIEKSSSALKIGTIRLSELAAYKIAEDLHAPALCTMIAKLFQKLLKDKDPTVQAKALLSFRQFSLRTNNESVITLVCADLDNGFKESLIYFVKNGDVDSISNKEWMKRLEATSNVKYTHKCKVASDFDTISDGEEMPSKKMKLNSGEASQADTNSEAVESALRRIESCIADLDKFNLSCDQSRRLSKLIDKLKTKL